MFCHSLVDGGVGIARRDTSATSDGAARANEVGAASLSAGIDGPETVGILPRRRALVNQLEICVTLNPVCALSSAFCCSEG